MIKRLYEHWMVRNDNNGISYNGFKWNPVGEWTEASDWIDDINCGNGLHGQGVSGDTTGFGASYDGSRFLFCEVDPLAGVVSLKDKIKCKRAKIIAVNEDALVLLLGQLKNNTFSGSLNLKSLESIPSGVTLSAVGYLNLRSLESMPSGVTLKAGVYLDLRSIKNLPENANIKAHKILLKEDEKWNINT